MSATNLLLPTRYRFHIRRGSWQSRYSHSPPGALHPTRGAPDLAGDDVERSPDPHHERHAEIGEMLVQPVLLARARDRQEQEVGHGPADGGDDGAVVVPVAIAHAGDLQGREPPAETAQHLVEHLVGRSEEVHDAPVDAARSTMAVNRSMPATRSGTGRPSIRLAHTIDAPSALTRSHEPTISRRRGSLAICTTFAALRTTCWLGPRRSTSSKTRSRVACASRRVDVDVEEPDLPQRALSRERNGGRIERFGDRGTHVAVIATTPRGSNRGGTAGTSR